MVRRPRVPDPLAGDRVAHERSDAVDVRDAEAQLDPLPVRTALCTLPEDTREGSTVAYTFVLGDRSLRSTSKAYSSKAPRMRARHSFGTVRRGMSFPL